VSAPGAAAFAGVGFLHALEEALGRPLVVDCGDDAGLVMAALRAGSRDLLFTGDPRLLAPLAEMAESVGGRVRDRLGLPVLCLDPGEDPARRLGSPDGLV
jgi:hypothetical protein